MAIRIVTDSTCDLPQEIIRKYDLTVLPFPIRFGEEEFLVGPDETDPRNIPVEKFFERIAAGEIASTSQIGMDAYAEAFGAIMEQGDDILYLCFSSGCTGTINSARLAGEELKEKYPDRTLRTVDTLSESLGEGMLVVLTAEYLAGEQPDLETLAKYAEETRLHVHHYFTIADLKYLARGGRLSNTAAIAGTILNLKPVLDTNTEGKLVAREKVQGRKKALRALADRYLNLCDDKDMSPLYIGHGHCEEDAQAVARMIEEKCGRKVDIINSITPVISAHCGIGTVAVFFVSKQERAN